MLGFNLRTNLAETWTLDFSTASHVFGSSDDFVQGSGLYEVNHPNASARTFGGTAPLSIAHGNGFRYTLGMANL